MRTFTGSEVRYLEIIAVNVRNPDMLDFLNRSVLTRLADEARLAGLILLKREDEVKEVSEFFSDSTLKAVRDYCTWIEAEATNTIAELEERIANTRQSYMKCA